MLKILLVIFSLKWFKHNQFNKLQYYFLCHYILWRGIKLMAERWMKRDSNLRKDVISFHEQRNGYKNSYKTFSLML